LTLNVSHSKPDARRYAQQLRARRSAPEAEWEARRIGTALRDYVSPADVVYAYAPDPARGELDLWPALSALASAGMKVALPRIVGKGLMQFHLWTADDRLVEDPRYGLLEPAPSAPTAPPPSAFVLPGLAASPEGVRLGYGGGFYDRAMAQQPSARRLFPLATRFLFPLPHEPHDEPVDVIVTERGALWTGARTGGSLQPERAAPVPSTTRQRRP
jgi:5-formyltetrahydrofolate cyclo-ligase